MVCAPADDLPRVPPLDFASTTCGGRPWSDAARPYFFVFCCLSAAAFAQNALPVLPTGDAAVAGFSGTVVLGSPPPPEPQRVDKTYINLDGPSLRVIGLDRMGGPPQAQLVAGAQALHGNRRARLGQVFSLALDDANPPNIYAAASSAYGLPIVVPDADGDGVPDRSRRGAPNAAFMPGLFGPITLTADRARSGRSTAALAP